MTTVHRIRAVFTDTGHGDLHPHVDSALLEPRRRALHPRPWTWLSQRHGNRVVTVRHPGHHAGEAADAAVTTACDAPISVLTADCAPVLLTGPGTLGVVHAGWRGLREGVLEATIDAMASIGARPDRAVLGPCIRVGCYEFGTNDLDTMIDRFGPAVAGETAWGTPGLDVAAAVDTVCRRAGLLVEDDGVCTACSPVHFSHRARREPQRQVLVAWIEANDSIDRNR